MVRESNRPLDVLLATLHFHPDYSGPAERFRRYAPLLEERGVKLAVFSAGWLEDEVRGHSPLPRGPVGRLLEPVTVDDLTVNRVVLSREMVRSRLHWSYFRALAQFLAERRSRPDVVQLLNISYCAIPCLFRLRQLEIPTVHTQTMVRNPSIGWIKNQLFGLPFRFLSRAVVSTKLMRDSLRSVGITTPISVIPNGVDLDRFSPASEGERARIRSDLGLPEDGELITFVGGYLQRRKGIDLLAEAWTAISQERPRAWLVLVGPRPNDLNSAGGEDKFLERVNRILEDSGARDRVIFTGRVSNVEDYLAASDVFVFPSRREGMPNVVPEAFASGIPSVLCPFVGLPDEFGRPGEQYLLAEHDPESLSECVLNLLRHRKPRQELSEAGRNWVEEHLGLASSCDQYADMYADLASLNPSPAVSGSR